MTTGESKQVIEVRFGSVEELEQTYQNQISKGGYFVPSGTPHPRATRVELRFHLPGLSAPLAVPAEVAFAATAEAPLPGMGAGMAMQFECLSAQIGNAFQAAITVAKSEGMDLALPGEDENVALPGEDEDPAAGTGAEIGNACADEESAEAEAVAQAADIEKNENAVKDLMVMLNAQTTENLYNIVRRLAPHQKIVAAKRGNRSVRNILLQEGNKKVMLFLLQNPQTGLAEVIQMLKLSNLSLEVLQQISKNTTFNQSEEIKYLLTTHPKTPLPMSLTLINTLTIPNIAKIAKSNLKAQLKSTALRLLEQRRK
jgi:hypothetical protein